MACNTDRRTVYNICDVIHTRSLLTEKRNTIYCGGEEQAKGPLQERRQHRIHYHNQHLLLTAHGRPQLNRCYLRYSECRGQWSRWWGPCCRPRAVDAPRGGANSAEADIHHRRSRTLAAVLSVRHRRNNSYLEL